MTARPSPGTGPSMAKVGWTVQSAFYGRNSHATRENSPTPCREAAQSNPGLEVLWGDSGGAREMVWWWVGAIRGLRLGCLERQAGFGQVAETRETGQGRTPAHRLAPDPSVESPATIPSERPIDRALLANGLAISG
jgi:hypothetical protein